MSRYRERGAYADDLTADKRAAGMQLSCSRRASDAVRARAAALNRSVSTVLDDAIKRGLAAMPDPWRDAPISQRAAVVVPGEMPGPGPLSAVHPHESEDSSPHFSDEEHAHE